MSSRRLSRRLGFLSTVLLVAVTGLLAMVAFVGVRSILLHERSASALRQAHVGAALVSNNVLTGAGNLPALLAQINSSSNTVSQALVFGSWESVTSLHPDESIPLPVRERTLAGHVTSLTTTWKGHSLVAVGIPLSAISGSYFLLDNLDALNHELRNIAGVIALGWLVVTLGGIVLMRRQLASALIPLERASAVVRAVAHGDTSQRIAPTSSSREIDSLAKNFNAMVDSLVTQMQRDAHFASDVSHELRSPLTSLTASADRLAARRDRLDEDSAHLVDSLQRDVATFSGLVTDLLELAQIDRGVEHLVLDEVNIHELMDRCVTLISRRDGVSLPEVVHVGDPAATCVVDRRRFERVLSNLVGNAVKYAGGVSALHVDIDDKSARLSVADLGPGIADEDRERIFDRFYRGQSAFNRGDTTGTGLGLALVRAHVIALGGTVTVQRHSPQGSIFTLVLPREGTVH